MLRKIIAAVASAVVAGLVLGLLSRALMRVISLVAGDPGEFSWGGTASIVVVYVVVALPGAVLAALTVRRWRWVLLALGAALLCVPAASITSADLGTTTGFSALQWLAVVVSVGAVFGTIAALPLLTLRLVDRSLALPGPTGRAAGPATSTARVS